MKVLAINGSPRSEGNTFIALSAVAGELEKAGIVTEIVHIGNKDIRGCIACGKCAERADGRCVFDDCVNELLPRMVAADGLLLGSPVYYAGINGTFKSFLDRAFYAAAAGGRPFRFKAGAAVVAVRRAGATDAFDQLNKYFSLSEMVTVGSNYWNQVYGRAPGESAADAEGLQSMRVLGRNMAWLLQVIAAGREQLPLPEMEPKIKTNFIR
ncbi:MAG: flavodoxin family protein [Victivallales bacterium]|nr:flavodoxin family protein [Victivallales bacterium]